MHTTDYHPNALAHQIAAAKQHGSFDCIPRPENGGEEEWEFGGCLVLCYKGCLLPSTISPWQYKRVSDYYRITFDDDRHVMVIYEAKYRQKAYDDRNSNPIGNLRAIKEEYGRA